MELSERDTFMTRSEGEESSPEQEASWIAQIAQGDRDAFEALYRSYRARLFGYLFRRTDDASLAEELASDVLFEVWRGAKRFRGDSRPSTWIFGIAHHKAMSAYRKRPPESVELDAAAQVADPGQGPEEAAAGEQRRRRLREAIRRLSPDHREVIDLTFFHGCSYAEIARIMKCPIATVKTRMFYARKKLLDIVGKMGWELEPV